MPLINVDAKQYTKHYICSECGLEETISSNKPLSANRTRKSGMCKKCRTKTYYQKDPTKHQNLLLQRRYGISLDTYHKMYEIQKGCCVICGKHSDEFSKNLCVDHDHVTNKIRALLCVDCNRNVGVYENYGDKIKQYLDFIQKGGLGIC